MEGMLHDIELGHDFLDMTQKEQTTKIIETNETYLKLRSFCASTNTTE